MTAIELWAETLVTKAEADSNESAMIWIADLKRTNPEYFGSDYPSIEKRLGRLCKEWERLVDTS